MTIIDSIQKRKNKYGGLHTQFRSIGDTLLIKHHGEELKIVFQGKNGLDQYDFSCIGNKNFVIVSPYNYRLDQGDTND